MKFIFIFIALTSLNFVYADKNTHSHKDHEHSERAERLSVGSIDPDGLRINVDVFGLVCDFCAQSIEKIFMNRNEVTGIEVDLANGFITIFTKRGEDIEDNLIKSLITDAGYNVNRISRK
ncbi:heavy-metal-associated domain-containing protein [bacterium]|jgi:hypothetical protein|nr:heavy-metal-associated domain-containing protein [bacterium]|tara:strand:+ start:566 stop:925 length:360 start_codon:yes stop_codon:yes gene_type:complete